MHGEVIVWLVPPHTLIMTTGNKYMRGCGKTSLWRVQEVLRRDAGIICGENLSMHLKRGFGMETS